MEKVFGVVILYQPTAQVNANISSWSKTVSKLFVFDNSEPASGMAFNSHGTPVQIIADGINRGIAERLNQAAKMAISEGATWLLTMDQDSSFEEKELKNYFSCFTNFENRHAVAMFGIDHEAKPGAGATCHVEETDSLITSGSLVNLAIFDKLGGFDEALFIDEVDYEYCLRANTKGYKTLKFPNIHLNHALGTVFQHRSLKSLRLTKRTLHSPVRLYYMCRNYLYVSNKYAKYNVPSLKQKKKGLFNFIKNNLLYGKNKLSVCRFIWLGYKHYKDGRTGRIPV